MSGPVDETVLAAAGRGVSTIERPPQRLARLRAADPTGPAEPDDGGVGDRPRGVGRGDERRGVHRGSHGRADVARAARGHPPRGLSVPARRSAPGRGPRDGGGDRDGRTRRRLLVGRGRRPSDDRARRDVPGVGRGAGGGGLRARGRADRASLRVDDAIVEPGSFAYVPTCYELLRVDTRSGTSRFLLLGGEPLGVPIKMWWNFVARTLDEITDAWRAWRDHDDDRFGRVPSSLDRIDAPTPPWLSRG